VSLYSRPDREEGQDSWTRHASGVLGSDEPAVAGLAAAAGLAGPWPPQDAEPMPVDGWYQRLAELGYGYGPSFRGLVAAWRRGTEVFAEVRLPEDQHGDAARFIVHPALLDAALHSVGLISADGWQPGPAGDGEAGGQGLVPFAWSGVQVAGHGARVLRVRLRPAEDGAVAVLAADPDGQQVVAADRLVLRPVSAGALRSARAGSRDSLFSVEWVPVTGTAAGGGRWAVLGGDQAAAAGMSAAGITVSGYQDLTGLAEAVASGQPAPPVVVAWLPGLTAAVAAPRDEDGAAAVRRVVHAALELVQRWLAEGAFARSVLMVVTSGAVAAGAGEPVLDVAGAAVQGLVRSAQAENPGQLVLADVDGLQASWQVLAGVVGLAEPEVAVRQGRMLARRLARTALPADETGQPWRLDPAGDGTLGGVRRVPAPEAAGPLGPGQVRVGVRAAGLNFRDVLVTLGTTPGPAQIGNEGAGVVTETGPGVSSVAAGDRVMGILGDALGPVTIADERMIVKMPDGWSFTQAASVPIVFATAYYALVDLAGLRAGETVLVHAAAGGVGMAAVQLARYLGAEVYATASPAKQEAVRELGVAPDRIASSRTTEFAARFRTATGGRGVDVVLDSLAGEFVDASLGLVAAGGRFIEMGKADIRDPGEIAARWPGVSYQAFDLVTHAGPERVGQILGIVLDLFARGILTGLPVRAWGLDQAGEALRFMGQGRHTGKNVIRVPAPLDRAGTVLITGASGVLAGLTARHLAGTGQAGLLLLASRRGPAAPGAAGLAADLAGLGAHVQVCAADAGDRAVLGGLLGQVPAERPLTAVVHTAGVLDDGVVGTLTPERVDRVMRPKADAAIVLDELTADAELSAFVLFSSAAATFGAAGQGNYAAANAVLDAVAQRRRARGLPGVSVAWGLWEQATGMTAHMSDADRMRASGGAALLSDEQGMELFDTALDLETPAAVAMNVNLAGMRAQAGTGTLPPLWQGLVRGPAGGQPAGAQVADTLRQQLASLSPADQDQVILDLVRGQAAAVLGHASPDPVHPGAAFRDLGFDSLTAIELRNRLSTVTGLRLPATLVFDHPSPAVLAGWLRSEIGQDGPAAMVASPPVLTELERLEAMLSTTAIEGVEPDQVTARLEAVLSRWKALLAPSVDPDAADRELLRATAENIFDLIDEELGGSQGDNANG
jgi:NADPH:quinone reductase-like Zn-dependent oxidoreductase